MSNPETALATPGLRMRNDDPPRAEDARLRERAAKVIPGGMFGHLDAARLPHGYPQFFARAEGCRLWDVDGNEYVDLMCSWGPMLVGYRHPGIEAAARRQAEAGDVMNGPSARMVELAERLVATIPHADWVLFQKNGTDATTLCVTVARARTGRSKVLAARGAYHGALPWCTPYPAGVTGADRANIAYYEYNDVASLEAAAAVAGEDLAAIIVSAFRHDLGRDLVLPDREFARAARALCDARGAALILDDVRAGFRLHRGGSWELVGVRPDLSAWSKAVANGHALAFVAGGDGFRDAATQVYSTGSFWCGGVAMAAALATLDALDAADGIAHMRRMGERLRAGIAAQAAAHGVSLRQSGPPQMPLVLFDDDPGCEKGFVFTAEALRRGAYLHPRHNMFLSVAHGPADIDRVLLATDEALAAVARRFGRG